MNLTRMMTLRLIPIQSTGCVYYIRYIEIINSNCWCELLLFESVTRFGPRPKCRAGRQMKNTSLKKKKKWMKRRRRIKRIIDILYGIKPARTKTKKEAKIKPSATTTTNNNNKEEGDLKQQKQQSRKKRRRKYQDRSVFNCLITCCCLIHLLYFTFLLNSLLNDFMSEKWRNEAEAARWLLLRCCTSVCVFSFFLSLFYQVRRFVFVIFKKKEKRRQTLGTV